MPDRITRRQFLLGASAVTVCCLAGPLPRNASSAVSLEQESRMIFDEGLNWVNRDSAERICSRIARAGFNAFSPCVWHGRGTIWPSSLAPWDSHNVRAVGFDPLGNLFKTAQTFGIEVHPWFTLSLRQRDFFPQFYDNGTPAHSFDVHRQEFRQFIASIVLEVARQYPVHGINLDFVYAGGLCTSPMCISDYKQQTGRDLLIDAQKQLVPGPAKEAITSWQGAAVTDMVQRISAGCRQINPNIVISLSGQPGHPLLPVDGQDSVKWADDRLIDVLYNMHYEPNPDFSAFKSIQSSMKRPQSMVVGIGNYEEPTATSPVRSRDPNRVADLIRSARTIQQGNGVAVYLYSMLNDAQIDTLRAGVFSQPATPHWIRARLPETPKDVEVS